MLTGLIFRLGYKNVYVLRQHFI